MRIIMMGPQACGKGTQGEKLSALLLLPLVTVGELLRDIPESHPRFTSIHAAMDKGELAPFEFVAELMKERVSKEDCIQGYILDGWGRSLGNIEHFNPGFDIVIVITLPREESIKRISGRRICESDGKTYNVYTMPKEEITCLGALVQRLDDNEEAVNRRLDIYYNDTQKVIDFFKKTTKVIEVDGVGTPDEVFERIKASLV